MNALMSVYLHDIGQGCTATNTPCSWNWWLQCQKNMAARWPHTASSTGCTAGGQTCCLHLSSSVHKNHRFILYLIWRLHYHCLLFLFCCFTVWICLYCFLFSLFCLQVNQGVTKCAVTFWEREREKVCVCVCVCVCVHLRKIWFVGLDGKIPPSYKPRHTVSTCPLSLNFVW